MDLLSVTEDYLGSETEPGTVGSRWSSVSKSVFTLVGDSGGRVPGHYYRGTDGCPVRTTEPPRKSAVFVR